MSDVIDLAARRARKAGSGIPQRAPDFELEGWLIDGEVQWIRSRGVIVGSGHGWTPKQQTAILIDAAWIHAGDEDPESGKDERPAMWALLDSDGCMTLLWTTRMFTDTNWRHALWFVRQWWWLSHRWWRMAWRAARGKG